MTDVTELEEIVVTGQRRKGPSDPFPRMMWVSVPPTPGQHDEKPMREEMEGHQCSVPERRRRWNRDANASGGMKDLLAYAADPSRGWSVFSREHGAHFIKTADGMDMCTITHGDPPPPGETANVTLDTSCLTWDDWMGDIHTHVSGDGRPSTHSGGD